MAEPKPASHVLRSIGAVVAGAIVNVALSLVTDFLLEKAGVLPHPGHPATSGPLLLATVYRTIYGVLGSYVAARLAPSRPMLHAMVLGFIGFALSLLGVVMTWNRTAEFGPRWYPVALVLLALPTAWLGGKLRLRQLRTTVSTPRQPTVSG
jgi:hypothetical protein